jgi:succinate dehydrogenase / fumarate reductase, cytochrome b subunit
MSRLQQFFGSTIGLKMVMAVTGVVWIGYVIAHMLGNLQIFVGREAINDYSKFLHDSPGLLWSARAVLLVSLIAHVAAYLKLTRTNLAARPQPYARRRDVATSFAARSMAWTGPLLLFFIVYHVLHLTLRVTPDVALDAHDVYSNLVNSFRIPWLVALYAAGMTFLGLHLFHGAWSFFQTLGANHPQWNPLRRRFAILVAVVVVGGFLAVPFSILAGIVRPADDLASRSTPSVLAD